MLKTLKRFAPFLLVNLLAFCCGVIFFHRAIEPQRLVVVKVTPRTGSEGPSIQGVKLRGATRAMLYKQLGQPIDTKLTSDDPRHTNQTKLLDNAFVWISFFPYIEANNGAEEKVIAVWFDFNDFSAKYQKKLYLTWEYKRRSYVLDETLTPETLKASFPDVIPFGKDDGQSFTLCDGAILVNFKNSKIDTVEFW